MPTPIPVLQAHHLDAALQRMETAQGTAARLATEQGIATEWQYLRPDIAHGAALARGDVRAATALAEGSAPGAVAFDTGATRRAVEHVGATYAAASRDGLSGADRANAMGAVGQALDAATAVLRGELSRIRDAAPTTA